MTVLLTSLFGGWGSLAFWGAAAAGLGFVALSIRKSGYRAAMEKIERERERAREIADQVDADIGAMPPDHAREELNRWNR